MERLRVVTYNVHKCRGLDNRVRPARIAEVIQETEADVIGLQEVISVEAGAPDEHQARFIAERLGFYYTIGENRRLNNGAYGNVLLSRFPFEHVHNYDISWRSREPRGCLRADIALNNGSILLHIFNVHLGTAFIERRYQGKRLCSVDILNNSGVKGPRIVMGDFNEWTRGLTSRLLSAHLESVDLMRYLRHKKTYPGIFPILHLDHVYYDPSLQLVNFILHRSRTALIASDHLPLIADFILAPKGDSSNL
jgi:endonuclease/exonuclease/phosphatase family metal-dependent hydrolase